MSEPPREMTMRWEFWECFIGTSCAQTRLNNIKNILNRFIQFSLFVDHHRVPLRKVCKLVFRRIQPPLHCFVPLLAGRHERAAWLAELMPAYDWFCERTVCGHASSVDAYGATSPDEFFAVASEAFFVKPEALKEEQPALYRLLATYYRQNPASY